MRCLRSPEIGTPRQSPRGPALTALSPVSWTGTAPTMPAASRSSHAAYQHKHGHVREGVSTTVGNETRTSLSTWTDARSLASGQGVVQYLWADIQLRAMTSLYQWQVSLNASPMEITADEVLANDRIVTALIRTSETGTGTLSVTAEMPQGIQGDMKNDSPVLIAWNRGEGVTFVIAARFDPSGATDADSTSSSARFTFTCYPTSSMRPARTLIRRDSRRRPKRKDSDSSLHRTIHGKGSKLSTVSRPPP